MNVDELIKWCIENPDLAGQRIEELEAALSDAADTVEEYSQYAGEYLCKKHDVAGTVAGYRKLLRDEDETTV